MSFSFDGKQIYYCFLAPRGPFRKQLMVYSNETATGWTEPEEIAFNSGRNCYYQFLVLGDKRLFYNSEYYVDNVYVIKTLFVDKTETGWTEPEEIIFSGKTEVKSTGYPSVAASGNLYFFHSHLDKRETNSADIYLSVYEDGVYKDSVRLSAAINTPDFHECHPYKSPDESFIIFDSDRKEDVGGDDLYISFKDKNGEWLPAINMGEDVNSKSDDRRPFATPDSKYFFFVGFRTAIDNLPDNSMTVGEIINIVNSPQNGSSDFYWVDGKVIDDLKLNFRNQFHNNVCFAVNNNINRYTTILRRFLELFPVFS